jgi:adenylosuccinate lyase
MLQRLAGLVASLAVFPQRMRAHLDASRGLVCSGAVLLALARRGVSRQDAYRLVQRHALATWDEGGHLHDRLGADPEVTRRLRPEEIDACFDLEQQLRNVDAIFERTLAQERAG